MSLSLAQLVVHAEKLIRDYPDQPILAYAWSQPWSGSSTLNVGDADLPLDYCDSPLAVRQALGADRDTPRVLLINVAESTLGQDVLARLARHRVLHVDRWQLVKERYGVHQIDPRLFAVSWMPDLLLEAAPGGRPPVASVLTQEQATAACLRFCWGLSGEPTRLDDVVLACAENASQWLAVDAQQRQYFKAYLATRFGSLVDALVALMDGGMGHAAVAVGLACEVLFADDSDGASELHDARIRLESRLGGHRLTAAEGRQWLDASLHLLERRGAAAAEDDRLATELLVTVGAEKYLRWSSVLSAGLDERLVRLGAAVERFLRAPKALPAVEAAVRAVLAHRRPPVGHPGPRAAQMAARLCRSIAGNAPAEGAASAGTYLERGAWQDWARRALRGVRPEKFARAVTRLLDAVAESRLKEDHAFAQELTAKARVGEVPAGVIPIENAMGELVAPIARNNPVVLVVMDGMSADVSLALGESLAQKGWSAWRRTGQPAALLATVPSVTECSRSSLFAGRLVRGDARREAQAFAQHGDLLRVSREGHPPCLFHKAGATHGHQLGSELAAAIADASTRVVAVVINAIDDSLAKSDQLRIDWAVETIPLLAEVLEHARRASRVVILTSDHGHVLERKSALLQGGEGERYRLASSAVAEGEIEIAGPRVHALIGSDVIAPWREDVRYSAKKNGYHGGVTRQEMIVPLGVWTAGASPVPEAEYAPLGSDRPAWWAASAEGTISEPRPATSTCKPARRARADESRVPDLFVEREKGDLVEQLLRSDVLRYQVHRLGRLALDAHRLTALLRQLERNGWRSGVGQLARAIEVQPIRMRGVITVLERTLNVDGFAVVAFERATGTVLIDVPLLRTQFQL